MLLLMLGMLLRLWFFLLLDVARWAGRQNRKFFVVMVTAGFVLMLLLLPVVIVVDAVGLSDDDAATAAAAVRFRGGFFHRLLLRCSRTSRLLFGFVVDTASCYEMFFFSVHQEKLLLFSIYDRGSGPHSFSKCCVLTFYGLTTTTTATATATATAAVNASSDTTTLTATIVLFAATIGSSRGTSSGCGGGGCGGGGTPYTTMTS